MVVYSYEILVHRSMVPATIELLEAMLRSHPNVSAFVLKGIYIPSTDELLGTIRYGGHLAITKDEYFHPSCALVIQNTAAQHLLSADLRVRIEWMLSSPNLYF